MSVRTGSSNPAWGFPLIAAGAALWGTDALFRRGLSLELPAATLVFFEHLLLVVFVAPLLPRAVRAARATFGPLQWAALLLIGAGASAGATILFTHAFTYGDPNVPLLLQKAQPLIAIAGSVLLLGERLMPRYFAFLIAGLAGAYLVAFPEPSAPTVSALMPALFALAAAALWGSGTVLGRHLSALASPMEITALRFAVGLPAAFLIVWLQLGLGAIGEARWADGPALVGLALVPGLLALYLYYLGLRDTPASAATLAELAFPVSAVAVNLIAFDERLTGSQYVGVTLLSITIVTMAWLGERHRSTIGVVQTREAHVAVPGVP